MFKNLHWFTAGVDFEYKAKLLIEERRGKKYYYVSAEPEACIF